MAEQYTPIIPQTITVHLGPPDSPAPNIQVPFIDYIKNVASSEIYPTWPENAIRANIYAITSFALNRIYTGWYRNRGYNFDITNSPDYDQAFIYQRDIFNNISNITDELFNDYIVREGSIFPLAAGYCSGTTVVCNGLSQWGTVTDAKNGLTPYQILQKYYGNNINIVKNAPVQNIKEAYPGIPLKLGSSRNEVKLIQEELNRISKNYPAISRIPNPNGVFDTATETSVKDFQKVFGLTPDGIVGKKTWYKIASIYTGVKQLGNLNSEGIKINELEPVFPFILKEGMSGNEVRIIQNYLATLAFFNPEYYMINPDGVFGPQTKDAVMIFQSKNNLTPDGIVGRDTWNALSDAYIKLIESLPDTYYGVKLYPGYVLSSGETSENVKELQRYLNFISNYYPEIPSLTPDGIFGTQTYNAVIAFQKKFGIPANGVVGPVTWSKIIEVYYDLQDVL